MFLRKPSAGATQAASVMASATNAYDPPVSKTLLERQRQNDLERNQEFDALRRLRKQGNGEVGNTGSPASSARPEGAERPGA